MEAIATPINWSEIPGRARDGIRAFRSPEGERMVLEQNMFVETRLTGSVLRQLSDEEMDHYRRPFRNPGEGRRPTLSWPRNLPIDGEPADIVAIVQDYGSWLAQSDVPKLFINAQPGSLVRGRIREFIRTWPNQTEVTVNGLHYIQEDSPDEIGTAIADFVKGLRAASG